MSETQDTYLHDLFIEEVKPALERWAGLDDNAAYNSGYTAGQKAQYDEFWDVYQNYGNRIAYNDAFRQTGWTNAIFKPKYSMSPTNASTMFGYSKVGGDLPDILSKLGIVLDFSQCTNCQSTFQQTNFTHLGVIDLSNATNVSQTFGWMAELTTIDKIVVSENTTGFNNTFNGLGNLANITFEGVLACNGLSLTSNALTHDTLMSVVNCLKDYSSDTSGTEWKVTFGSTNLAKLTQAEKDIAHTKGWTLA